MVEQTLDSSLRFGLTPLDLLLSHPVAASFWIVLLWGLFAATVALYLTDHPVGEMRLGIAIMIVSTAGLLTNVGELVRTLPERTVSEGMSLLADGGMIWAGNILVFTIWYWLLDGGGYLRRAKHERGVRDFLFPTEAIALPDYPDWRPSYVDYLFLAFSTSTAFSPADTQTLSHRAKLFQMAQALTSLVVTALIVARAVNIITTG